MLPHGDWRTRLPPSVVLLPVVGLLSLIPVVQLFQEQFETQFWWFDGAAANLISILLTFLATSILHLWFTWFSVYSLQTRRIVFYAPTVMAALACIFLRYEGVDGYMKPTFAWRWEPQPENHIANKPTLERIVSPIVPAPEQAREQPVTAPEAQRADLLTETADDFAQFMGPSRNNYLPRPALSSDWKTTPPQELWRSEVGPGWAGFVVRNGFAVTMEQRGEEEWVTCYAVATGEPIWHHAAPGKHHEPLGGTGPRSTPTIDDGLVYAVGATGLLRCLRGETGELVWQDDLLQRYQLTQVESEERVKWGHAGSPLIVGDLVIVPAGGKGDNFRSLIAFDKKTGEVRWEAGSDQLSYASPAFATLGGVPQVLYVSERKFSGFDLQSGEELWSFPWLGYSNMNANASQGIPLGDDRVLVSKGYGNGAALLEVKKNDDAFAAEPVWESRRVLKTKFTNGTVIDGYAYALSDGILECVDVETGKQKWRGGRYGHGQLLGVGDKLLVVGEAGDLMLVAASPEKFQQLGKIEALSDKAWNNLCLTGHRLLIRNGKEAVCYELP